MTGTLCRLQRHTHLAWHSILPLIQQVTWKTLPHLICEMGEQQLPHSR